MTSRGIEYNLKISPYKTVFCEVVFHFSSKLYQRSFESNLPMFIYEEQQKFFKKHHFNGVSFLLGALMFYVKTEKRGFYITQNGSEFQCQETVALCGENLMNKELNEKLKTSTQKLLDK